MTFLVALSLVFLSVTASFAVNDTTSASQQPVDLNLATLFSDMTVTDTILLSTVVFIIGGLLGYLVYQGAKSRMRLSQVNTVHLNVAQMRLDQQSIV